MNNLKRFFPFVGVLLVLAFIMTACGAADTQEPQAATDVPAAEEPAQDDPIKVGLFFPDKKTSRYDTKDRPFFEAELKKICPTCELTYSNVDADAAAQLSAVQAAVANGVDVIVLTPVDSQAAAVSADYAEANGIPVIAYSRPIYDSTGVTVNIEVALTDIGVTQAEELVKAMEANGVEKPNIVMINGGPSDGNMAIIKDAAMTVFQPLIDSGELVLLASMDTPGWDPNNAQDEMQQILTANAGTSIDGIYVMNDGMAGGVVAALNAAGINPMPPITGLDVELAAVQRILSGQQLMSVMIPIKDEAEIAAQIAYALATTGEPPADLIEGTVDNGAKSIPNVTVPVVSVDKTNIMETVVAEGFWTVEEICTQEYKAACEEAGIK